MGELAEVIRRSSVDAVAYGRQLAAGDFTPDALAWMAAGLRAHFETREKLEDCLGLTVAAKKKYRDRALLAAAVALRGGRDVSPWTLAKDLHHAVARFQRRHHGDGEILTELDTCIQEALSCGCAATCSRRRLYDLVTDNFDEIVSADRVLLREN